MYLTKVDALPERFNVDAFHISDILQVIRPQLSIHFNFMIDLEWLIRQYPAPCRGSPMVCVVGEKMGTDKRTLQHDVKSLNLANVSVLGAPLPIPFGTHHTKLSIFDCESDLHVIVSTANLIEMWFLIISVSHQMHCSRHPMEVHTVRFFIFSTTSTSEFASDLCAYLSNYHLDGVNFWIDRIRNCDFSEVSDRLVFSVPGYHPSDRMDKFGHLSLARLLRDRTVPDPGTRRLLLAQCSSIGSLGDRKEAWLFSQFLRSLQGGKESQSARLFLIYPCVEDVKMSLEGYSAGDSLPYQEATAKRQPWLRDHMCKWRSEVNGRSKAMPHVKTYTDIVDGVPQWLLVTSANLSKAAWGDLQMCIFQKNKTQLMVRSYELGVLITDPARVKLPYDYPVVK
ncbi:unnamed protein product [Heligmosomoides polygyrus]|uniref:Tyrosyl-DNA phosphodiesterase 1 n=1 Tax=Heligmosomoides polygyrus TaxID=6339 RepID=A0A183G9N6_HELPZ|nr:unnamed protein product [Heligmosomoides polygyrus]